MPLKTVFVIKRNDDGLNNNSGQFLEKIGEWFIYFEEDIFWAMQFEDERTAQRVMEKYFLSDCKVRKMNISMDLAE